jgi:GntR family transcriptional regulator
MTDTITVYPPVRLKKETKTTPVTPTAHARLRADPRPLYAQACEAIKKLMQPGIYAPGARLPSEIELSQRLGISRPTLREALHQLEEEGVIVRKHGVGTFVATPPSVIEAGLEILESLDRLAERCGLSTQMREFSAVERVATPQEQKKLSLHEPTKVTEVGRVILAGADLYVAYLLDVVPQEYLCQADLGAGFKGSVLDLFLERGWPPLAYSRAELFPEAANAELAERLHIRRGALLQKFEALLFAADGRVVDYSLSYFVPGHFRFHVIRRVG